MRITLKYLIAVKIDNFPRTHSLAMPFKELANLYGESVMAFYSGSVSTITSLEQAYIGAREIYIDFEFDAQIEGLRRSGLARIF